MSTIGSLSVNIAANTGPLQTGLSKASSLLGKFTSQIGNVSNILGGIGIAGMVAFTKEAVAAVDALGDLSANLSMSAEALQALDYAAVQTGGSAEALHAGLAKMQRTLGDAANGGDKAIGAFNQLGLDFNKLLALPVEQQFLAIVDALNKVQDRSQRAADAQGIFGKGSKELNAVINSGTDEIILFSDELARMGGILSQDSVDAIGKAQSEFDKFSAMMVALKNDIVASYAEEIPLAMNIVIDSIKLVRAVMLDASAVIIQGVSLMLKGVRELINNLNFFLPQSLEISTQGLQSFIDTFDAKSQELRDKAQAIIGGTEQGPLKPVDASKLGGSAMTAKDYRQQVKDRKAEEKETAKNTKIVADQLKEMTKLMKQGYSQNQAYVKVAGVR